MKGYSIKKYGGKKFPFWIKKLKKWGGGKSGKNSMGVNTGRVSKCPPPPSPPFVLLNVIALN